MLLPGLWCSPQRDPGVTLIMVPCRPSNHLFASFNVQEDEIPDFMRLSLKNQIRKEVREVNPQFAPQLWCQNLNVVKCRVQPEAFHLPHQLNTLTVYKARLPGS